MHKYLVIFEKTDTGYSVYVPDLPGCVSTGSTKEEAEKNIAEAIEMHIESMIEDGESLPLPTTESEVLLITKSA
jgi:predicted RNase H-like HicB family nuclease